MKIAENPACRRYCGRIYKKARARGISSEEFNNEIKKRFGAENASLLEYESYKLAIAMLNALPLIKGHESQPKKKNK